ncbi:hypothetical protein [Streptomyces caeruleatus]|uniref:hypothetical protein n=1 Tax=Streptomyces caeruleatus TaxID=661399 RepID=UPI00131E21CA|nr:hypothetical protein [Streptomyces caeruleatus]
MPPVCPAASLVSSAQVASSSSVVPIRARAVRTAVSRDDTPRSGSGVPRDATGRALDDL